jgi:hypothetical protein
LDDVGGALSWSALNSFIRNLGRDSALSREINNTSGWETTSQTNAILADIYDILQVIALSINHKKKSIKPYPRPGKDKDRKIGRQAVSKADLEKWFKEKRNGRR